MTNRREHLAGHTIVWIAYLSKTHDSHAFFEPCLDAQDRERAAHFRFAPDRSRFVLGWAMLRKCLGHYLDLPPESVELGYTDRGQPIYPPDTKIKFSISHTQDLVGIALTENANIGIDLEAVSPHLDLIELAERIFSPDDLAVFNAHPPGEKLAAFYRAWTRKEAYLKARGEGIAEGLEQISVSMGPEEVHSLKDSRNRAEEEKWHLMSLPLPHGYAGTLACDDMRKHLEGSFMLFPKGDPTLETAWCFRPHLESTI